MKVFIIAVIVLVSLCITKDGVSYVLKTKEVYVKENKNPRGRPCKERSKSKLVNFKFYPDEVEAIKKELSKENVSLTEFIENCFTAYLDEKTKYDLRMILDSAKLNNEK